MKSEQSLQDVEWMLRAIALGMKARRSAPPNPWVGCVLVQNENVVGEGYTQTVGNPHAEVVALRAAGASSQGATAYVTLEPCCHYGRTPPCTRALIQSGISRVVVSLEDPDPRVHGCGIAELQSAGIEVCVGICADAAREALRPYLHQRSTGRPWCIVKAALSIDGRVAAKDGSSQWISGEEARADAHQLRADSQAILVGAGTALRDQPSLTVRDAVTSRQQQPLRVLLDSSGKVPATGPLFDPTLAATLVFTSALAPSQRIQEWIATGAQVITIPRESDGTGVNLATVLDELGSRGILQLLVEGGSQVHSRLLTNQLGNQLTVYHGPLLLGDQGVPFLQGNSPSTTQEAKRYRLVHSKRLDETLRSDYALA